MVQRSVMMQKLSAYPKVGWKTNIMEHLMIEVDNILRELLKSQIWEESKFLSCGKV